MVKRIVAVALAAAVVLGIGVYAWAQQGSSGQGQQAQQQTPATTQPAQKQPRRRGQGANALLGRVVHGDLVVRNGTGFENVTLDRGTVTSASGQSVTVQRPDGQSVMKAVNADTKFRGVAAADQLQVGKPAVVESKGDTAVVVAQPKARPGGPGGAGQGPRQGTGPQQGQGTGPQQGQSQS